MTSRLVAAIVAAVSLLSACSSDGGAMATAAAPRMAPGPTLLAQVREAGKLGKELDVQPLRDPQVEDLRLAASSAEARSDWAAAAEALAQAAKITPDDPELLQWQAEIALAAQDFARAQQLATQSWQRGAQLGGLCRRNWTTIRFAAESRGDSAAATQAQQHAATCAVAPPNRF